MKKPTTPDDQRSLWHYAKRVTLMVRIIEREATARGLTREQYVAGIIAGRYPRIPFHQPQGQVTGAEAGKGENPRTSGEPALRDRV